ncbi:CGH_1_collapsed_G0027640.mRNA.1.CDS.1 [Saccharomyces cerevisiae]|nr:CGH_1_collapsed_G0027640.mRNA.1.CDS.1 [Saccharomyces cerevisiae]
MQKEVIHNFKKGEYNVLVCTSIGEEGLDIGEVDLIICYDTTSSPIKNIQRMGRTGRKRDGKIVLLFSSNESYNSSVLWKTIQPCKRLYPSNALTTKNQIG